MPRLRLRRRVDLKKTLFLLPNMITLASVFCGFQSVRIAAESFSHRQLGHEVEAANGFFHAALLLVYALFFDTMDGRVARATKTQSSFGLQLDSLADALSFGVAPGMLVYLWSLHRLGLAGQFVGFFFAACAVVRLARFNVLSMDESGRPTKPSKYIVGLPSPGAAGMLIGVTSSAIVSYVRGPAFVLVWLLAIYVSIGFVETAWNFVRRLTGRSVEEAG